MVRSRRVDDEVGGGAGGWEEFVEYIFPDAEAEQPNRQLLAAAAKWVASGQAGAGGDASSSDSEDSSEEEDEGVGEDPDADDNTALDEDDWAAAQKSKEGHA